MIRYFLNLIGFNRVNKDNISTTTKDIVQSLSSIDIEHVNVKDPFYKTLCKIDNLEICFYYRSCNTGVILGNHTHTLHIFADDYSYLDIITKLIRKEK